MCFQRVILRHNSYHSYHSSLYYEGSSIAELTAENIT